MSLFERTNNRIILNQQGRIFLRYVNRILGELDSAKTELLQSTMVRGSYVALASVASTQWVDLIAAFSKSKKLTKNEAQQLQALIDSFQED